MKLMTTRDGQLVDLNYAQKVIENNCEPKVGNENNEKPELFGGLTTSKLRNLLNYLNNIYNKVYISTSTTLSEDICDELEYLKVKFAYEAAREDTVKEFMNKTHVSEIIDVLVENKTKKKFLDYCKYFEALVAYAKFYGKED